MMIQPSREELNYLRESYPNGARIELVHMGPDPYSKLMPGDRGTVDHVDDAGNIHVRWDCGSGLALAYGEDSCRKLTEAELAEEQKMADEQKMAEEPELEEAGPEMSI